MTAINTDNYAKISEKTLNQQIDVVAEFYAHKIAAQRIAYRTGVKLELVVQLINGDSHPQLFKRLLALHRRKRRDSLIKRSYKTKGIAQASLQDKIELEYSSTVNKP